MRPVRALSGLTYAAAAFVGEAVTARPALLWLRQPGLSGPRGAAAAALSLAIAAASLLLAATAAPERRLRLRAALLTLLALAMALRPP